MPQRRVVELVDLHDGDWRRQRRQGQRTRLDDAMIVSVAEIFS
jgi:hypothetical protein